MSDAAREQLKSIVTENPATATGDIDQLESMLRDRCGSLRREISLIGAAAREGIPALLTTKPAPSTEALALRLQNARGITSDAARYAVESWAFALGRATVATGGADAAPARKPTKKASNVGGVVGILLVVFFRAASADPTLKPIASLIGFLFLGGLVIWVLWSITNWLLGRSVKKQHLPNAGGQ